MTQCRYAILRNRRFSLRLRWRRNVNTGTLEVTVLQLIAATTGEIRQV